jgi:hypothetical protein
MKLHVAVLLAAVALAAGCSSHPAAPTASTRSPSPAAPASSATPASTPLTAAAARSAGRGVFALYAAGQYSAVYPLLDAQTRAEVPEHNGSPSTRAASCLTMACRTRSASR